MYAAAMPKAANIPAPASAPPTRAVSDVVRAIPIAAVSSWVATLSAIRERRTPRSEGRTRPIAPAIANTSTGVSAPLKATAMRVAASTV